MIKNITRSLSKKKIQTGVLFLLVFLAGLIFTYFDIPLTALKNATDHLFENTKTEQFRFMISGSSSDTDHLYAGNEFLTSKYGFESEPVRKKFVQQEFNNKKCNFYIRPIQKMINAPIFLKGSAPSGNGQVSISKLFAEKNGLMVGAHIKIGNKDCVVSGIHIAADSVVVLDATKSVDVARDTNADVIMPEHDYDAVDKAESVYFVGRFAIDDEDYIHSQVSNLSKEDIVLFANVSTEYQEISVLPTVINANTGFMFFALFLVYTVLGISIFIHVFIQFASYRKPIGVLLTIGVSKSRIVFSHGVYALVFGAATALGLIVGFYMTDGNIADLSDTFNVVITQPPIDWLKVILFWMAVTVALTLFVMLYAYIETKKRPLALIYSSDSRMKIGVFGRIIKKMVAFLKFENRIKVSIAVYKQGRFLMMIFVFFIACNLLGTGLSIQNSTANAYFNYKEFIKFDHVEIHDTIQNDLSESDGNADVFIDTSVKLIKNVTANTSINTTLTMEGISIYQKSLGIDSKKLENGIIIPHTVASRYGIALNEELQFLIDGEYYRYRVTDINGTAYDNKIYIGISELYKMSQYNVGDYNGAYVLNDSKERDALYSMRSEDLVDFSASINQSSESVSGMLLLLSIAISLALIILVAAFNYNDVLPHVAVFKFLGYSNRKSNDMLINVFDLAGIIGCLLGVFSIPYLAKAFEIAMMVSTEYYMPFQATWFERIATVFALMFLYGFCKFAINTITKGRVPATVLRSE
ncbi:MAG: ABC transporter permease [Peptococcaceae bacterium]|nr:ABC transporter permease [Peptococcaceae bacterium]